MKRFLITSILGILAFGLFCSAAPAQNFFNPYWPTNAVAAEPPTPYNLDQIPTNSNKAYLPCPNCGPLEVMLPDLPSVSQPFAGPFGMPVPVP
jgi:hypothetical protein